MADADERPEHSPLGASGAERWMNCPGSAALLRDLKIEGESDEPDYRREGTALHKAAEHCLNTHSDAWEIVGQPFNDTEIDDAMGLAIQSYLDFVRPIGREATVEYVEWRVSSPVHPDFYGTADYAACSAERLDVVDLKGGVGIVVEPDDNPQMKYYAYGVLETLELQRGFVFPDDFPVRLTIAQPRAWHSAGPIRSWLTTAGEIKAWVHGVLVPAMLATEYDETLDAGAWCRFCPAKLVCPLLTSLFRAAAVANPKEVVNLNDESLGRSYQYLDGVTFYIKAMKEETLRRAMAGTVVPGTKLVNKKANRVFKPEALDLAKAQFGDDAFTQPELKGPPAIEKLGPKGAAFVREYAFTPNTGYTIALESDSRVAVRVDKASETFAASVKALETGAT